MIRGCLFGYWIFCLLTAFDAGAEMPGLGLRFIVDHTLGQTEKQQQAVKAGLARNVAELNGFFASSEVNLAAEIVQIDFARLESVDAMTLLEDMARERGGFDRMFAKADEYGADYTFAIVNQLLLRGKRSCGRAYAVNKTVAEISSTRRAFAVIDIACGAHTLAHELGHLMGLNHGERVDACQPDMGHKTAIAPYANGYAEGNCDGKPGPGKFGTIMVGGWMAAINGDGRGSLRMFSNPRIRDPRCGISGRCGNPETGDAARALNENAIHYASHEEPDVHVLPYGSPALAYCVARKYKFFEISELENLECEGGAIDNISGIERLSNLKYIDLGNNRIVDFSPLAQLSANIVEAIDLSGNSLAFCPSIASLFHKFGRRVTPPRHCHIQTDDLRNEARLPGL